VEDSSRTIVRHYCELGNAEDAESGESGNDRVILDAETRDFPVTMDCLEDDFIKAGGSVYLLPLFGGESGSWRVFIRGNEGSAEEGSVGGGNDDEIGEKSVPELMIRGIVLQHSGLTKGRFRRIGCFDFRHEPSPLDDVESKRDYYYGFLQAVEEVGASTAESECAEIISDAAHPESRYVIIIV